MRLKCQGFFNIFPYPVRSAMRAAKIAVECSISQCRFYLEGRAPADSSVVAVRVELD